MSGLLARDRHVDYDLEVDHDLDHFYTRELLLEIAARGWRWLTQPVRWIRDRWDDYRWRTMSPEEREQKYVDVSKMLLKDLQDATQSSLDDHYLMGEHLVEIDKNMRDPSKVSPLPFVKFRDEVEK